MRVRRAISKAINRQAIADRVMEGQAIPSGQLVSEKLFGYVPGLKADAYDPEGAKKLLAEAGYPDGFNLTIHGPSGRYVNDEKIVQAVAQMLPADRHHCEGRDGADGAVLGARVEAGVQLPHGRLGRVDRRGELARCARCSRRSTATRAWAPSTGAATATPRSTT